jgi:hypothetical protein
MKNYFTSRVNVNMESIRLVCIWGFFFTMMALPNELLGQNLIPNPGFEQDSFLPYDKPDYYRYRMADYHHIETNPANVYEGNQCALFNNDSGYSTECYYYAFYTADGITEDFEDADTGCEYELSIKYRTEDADSSIKIQLIFCDGSMFVGQINSEYFSSTTWDTIRIRGIAKGRVDKISAGVYYKGTGKAWVDNFSLTKIHEPLCKNGSFEVDSVSPFNRPDFYKSRTATEAYHYTEKTLDNTYLGRDCVMFDSPSAVNACYFYGPYDEAGINSQYIPVCPGDTYEISGFGRVDTDFSGSGIMLSALFWNNGSYISRSNSPYYASQDWAKITKELLVPAGATEMSYSIEYLGQNKGWADEISLKRKNLVVNSCFETDTASPADKPDYWRPRVTLYHSIETNQSNVYEGSSCALFDNTSASDYACYLYGPYDATGDARGYISVIPGETYSISAYAKVDADFTGSGVFVSFMFQKDGVYVSRSNSSYYTPSDWTQIVKEVTVPADVNEMLYTVEYLGRNKAWFDKIELYKTDTLWYYKDASTDSLENLSYTPPAKISLSSMIDKFNAIHSTFEANYNNDGSWGIGYGEDADNHPLVRCTANAVLGYINAYSKISNQNFLVRAKEGLDWLVDEQLESGAFTWYCEGTPKTTGETTMYESGLAGAALIEGYRYIRDGNNNQIEAYLQASNNVCDYFLTMDASLNANFNAFAIWALAENYKETGTTAYLDKALFFADCMLAYQLDSGMWADEHNQYIWYHGIITRSLVMLLNALPAGHPKQAMLQHALYKALNHLRRSHTDDRPDGALIAHPITKDANGNMLYTHDPHSTSAVALAYGWLGITGMSDSLGALTNAPFTDDVCQGFGIEAAGNVLELAY